MGWGPPPVVKVKGPLFGCGVWGTRGAVIVIAIVIVIVIAVGLLCCRTPCSLNNCTGLYQPFWRSAPARKSGSPVLRTGDSRKAPVCERRHTHGGARRARPRPRMPQEATSARGAGAARIHEQLSWNRHHLFFFCFCLFSFILFWGGCLLQ